MNEHGHLLAIPGTVQNASGWYEGLGDNEEKIVCRFMVRDGQWQWNIQGV
jgi:hypothetical protein